VKHKGARRLQMIKKQLVFVCDTNISINPYYSKLIQITPYKFHIHPYTTIVVQYDFCICQRILRTFDRAKPTIMELKEFITSVIDDICDSVTELQTKYNPDAAVAKAVISPATLPEHRKPQQAYIRMAERVGFDVCVDAYTTKGADGKLGISIITVQAEAGISHTNSIHHRVSFTIPILLPAVTSTLAFPN